MCVKVCVPCASWSRDAVAGKRRPGEARACKWKKKGKPACRSPTAALRSVAQSFCHTLTQQLEAHWQGHSITHSPSRTHFVIHPLVVLVVVIDVVVVVGAQSLKNSLSHSLTSQSGMINSAAAANSERRACSVARSSSLFRLTFFHSHLQSSTDRQADSTRERTPAPHK
jgi:hypothetical protein